MRKFEIVTRRPAETGAIVASLAMILASLGVELSPNQWRLLAGVVGLVAACITWWRSHRDG